jgi:precorrin-6A/cobalt-precorrin-6A reductase
MILILAGTRDGRELAVSLAMAGYPVIVSVVSDYGGELAKCPELTVQVGALDTAGLASFVKARKIVQIIDASHPYATGASVNAMQAANETGAGYLRYERPASSLPSYERLHIAADAQAAAKAAASFGQVLFLTTGSRTLRVFKSEITLASHRLIARVLPDPVVIAECIGLGFSPKDIVAMQGPFSLELNIALFRAFAADVIVTKNSGEIGGADTKIQAAMQLGLHLVVIDRPQIKYSHVVHSIEKVHNYVKEALYAIHNRPDAD